MLKDPITQLLPVLGGIEKLNRGDIYWDTAATSDTGLLLTARNLPLSYLMILSYLYFLVFTWNCFSFLRVRASNEIEFFWFLWQIKEESFIWLLSVEY